MDDSSCCSDYEVLAREVVNIRSRGDPEYSMEESVHLAMSASTSTMSISVPGPAWMNNIGSLNNSVQQSNTFPPTIKSNLRYIPPEEPTFTSDEDDELQNIHGIQEDTEKRLKKLNDLVQHCFDKKKQTDDQINSLNGKIERLTRKNNNLQLAWELRRRPQLNKTEGTTQTETFVEKKSYIQSTIAFIIGGILLASVIHMHYTAHSTIAQLQERQQEIEKELKVLSTMIAEKEEQIEKLRQMLEIPKPSYEISSELVDGKECLKSSMAQCKSLQDLLDSQEAAINELVVKSKKLSRMQEETAMICGVLLLLVLIILIAFLLK